MSFYNTSSSNSCVVLSLIYRSLWVNFCMWCKVMVQLHFFACGYPSSPAPFVKDYVFSPLNCLDTLVKNQLTIHVRVLLCPVGVHVVFMPVLHCFDYCSFVVTFEILNLEVWVFQLCFFFSTLGFPIWVPLRVHINFRMGISVSAKHATGITQNL